jgi:hypothetical protein
LSFKLADLMALITDQLIFPAAASTARGIGSLR